MYRLYEGDLYEGMTLEARFENAPDSVWYNYFIPIRIEKEFPTWFLCTVLPHVSKDPRKMGMSSPYRMTINKHSLRVGEVVCRTTTLL